MILRDDTARERWRWTPHFHPGEFECRHCHDLAIDTEFLDTLTTLRELFARPIVIASGYRCPAHNVAVSESGPEGPHTTGAAADAAVMGVDAYDFVRLALAHGMTGVGIQQAGPYTTRFVHVDNLRAPRYPRPRIWSYTRAA